MIYGVDLHPAVAVPAVRRVRNAFALYAFACGLAGVAFLLDIVTPTGIADGFLYVLAVLVCLWIRGVNAALYVAAGLTVPFALGAVLSPAHAPWWLDAANRAMGVTTVWATALVIRRHACLRLEREQLLIKVRRLRALAERATVGVRRETAHWLHESVAQELAAVGWGLDRIAGKSPDAHGAARVAEGLREIISGAQREVRSHAAQLRGTAGVRELQDAVRRQADHVASRTGLQVGVHGIDELPNVPDDRTELCFRVVQEGLTNVVQHANATQVAVEFDTQGCDLVVSIADDGCGIAVADRRKPGALGLLGLEERLASVDGTLTVERVASHGTKIEARIPRS